MYWIGRLLFGLTIVVIGLSLMVPSTLRHWAGESQDSGDAVAMEIGAKSNPATSDTSTTETDDDNLTPSTLRNPLTQSLEKAITGNREVFEDAEDGLRSRLEEADRRLTTAKLDIKTAIREANRQLRTPGIASPLVIMVIVDGATFSDFGFYENAGATPLLEGLAERGTVFTSCYAGPAPEVARYMLLTGQGHSYQSARQNRLAEMAWKSGYHPILLTDVDWITSSEQANYEQRFVVKSDDPFALPTQFELNGNVAKVVVNQNDDKHDDLNTLGLLISQARHALDYAADQRPRLIQLHVSIPTDGRQDWMLQLDQQLGRLIHSIENRRRKQSVLLMVAGLPRHEADEALDEDNLRTPLMIYQSEKSLDQTIDLPCGLFDLLPSVADAIRSSKRPRVAGTSLLKEAAQMEPRIFRWTTKSDQFVAVRDGQWKAIFGGEPELYYLPDDPQEQTNVAAGNPDVLQRLEGYASIQR